MDCYYRTHRFCDQILSARLENENSFLVYGIEVVTADRTIMDVAADAGSGKDYCIHLPA
ncbi:MAG: hypothetical protein GXP56_05340 [Deltaproteobacteria bacterium]|nr:hypothetical protein [Deltaproteobacteria bacterium]